MRKIGLLFMLLDNLFVPVNLGFDFRLHYILYFLFIVYFLFVYRTIKFQLNYLLYIVIILFILSLAPLTSGSGYLPFVRQIALFSFNLLFSYLLINAYRFDLKQIFFDYIQLIYVASIVGLIQICSQIIGFEYGADYSYLGFDMQNFTMQNWKIQSWFQEPSFLAIAFTPVAFICIARLFRLTEMISVQKSVVIIVTLILSQSSVGLIGLLLSLLIVMTTKYSLARSPLIVLGSFTLIFTVALGFYSLPQVKLRVDDTAALFFSSTVRARDIEKVNISTYSMYSNVKVTEGAFMDNPFLGSGLGTYELDYFKYINVVLPKNALTDMYKLNASDANSMFLRIIAELGLFGLLVTMLFLYNNRIRINVKKQSQLEIDYWVINSATFVLFVVRLLRQGHYTMLGFMVFVLIFWYSKKQYNELLTDKTDVP